MARTEMWKMLGSVAALAVSYAAAFWLLASELQGMSVIARVGWISSVVCVLGVGVYFWATILAPFAKRRQWSPRECQFFCLLTVIPGVVFLLTSHAALRSGNLLLYQALFSGFLLVKFVHPDFYMNGPFERNPRNTLFPK
jgi:hypothetical protein